jgi:hypothetical protein
LFHPFQQVAIKTMDAQSGQTEIDILRGLDHPNIIQLWNSYSNGSSKILILPRWGQSISSYMRSRNTPLCSGAVRSVAFQLTVGLAYLHDKHIIHGDLHNKNILVDKLDDHTLTICICDFNSSIRLPVSTEHAFTGSRCALFWRAPEILLHGPMDFKADIWSQGCVVWFLATQTNHFAANCQYAVLLNMFKACGTPNEATWPGVSQYPAFSSRWPDFRGNTLCKEWPLGKSSFDFVRSCLTLCPQQRLSASAAQHHLWFSRKAAMMGPGDNATDKKAARRAKQSIMMGAPDDMNDMSEHCDEDDGDDDDEDMKLEGDDAGGKAAAAAATAAAAAETQAVPPPILLEVVVGDALAAAQGNADNKNTKVGANERKELEEQTKQNQAEGGDAAVGETDAEEEDEDSVVLHLRRLLEEDDDDGAEGEDDDASSAGGAVEKDTKAKSNDWLDGKMDANLEHLEYEVAKLGEEPMSAARPGFSKVTMPCLWADVGSAKRTQRQTQKWCPKSGEKILLKKLKVTRERPGDRHKHGEDAVLSRKKGIRNLTGRCDLHKTKEIKREVQSAIPKESIKRPISADEQKVMAPEAVYSQDTDVDCFAESGATRFSSPAPPCLSRSHQPWLSGRSKNDPGTILQRSQNDSQHDVKKTIQHLYQNPYQTMGRGWLRVGGWQWGGCGVAVGGVGVVN